LFDGHDQQRIKTLSVDFGGKEFFATFIRCWPHAEGIPYCWKEKGHQVGGLQSISPRSKRSA
jgi:hypothetical protein